jgi:2-methylisocitrate lyase-like PEP mutase family enzyme
VNAVNAVTAVTAMPARPELVAAFRDLHRPGQPLLMPNPWDAGSARALARLGYRALATTSSGFAATLGRLDGTVTRAQALRHAADIVAATGLPVSADLENGFADEPAAVAELVRDAIGTGLAGCSIEDATGRPGDPIYDPRLAAERVAAAAEAAHRGPDRLVLTARAENYLHGRPDLTDTIARLRSFQEAGADVLYAPGLTRVEDIKTVVSAVDLPLNVLALPGGPPVAALADLGVSRVSVGGAFAFTALDALVTAARELLEEGTYGYGQLAARGRDFARTAFGADEDRASPS